MGGDEEDNSNIDGAVIGEGVDDVALVSGLIYCGNIDSINKSGRAMIKDCPLGNHEMTSAKPFISASFNIICNFSGKDSFTTFVFVKLELPLSVCT